MKARAVPCLLVPVLLFAAQLTAAPLLKDGFEVYKRGELDANDSGGQAVNASPNGGANPWWGPNPENAAIVGVDDGVSPHSGTNMLVGALPGQGDREFFNLAYRLNNSNAYTGNITLDWWFFDPLGASGTNGFPASDFQCSASLDYFAEVPTNADYDANVSDLTTATPLQRLAIGGGETTGGSYNQNKYQAQILNAAAAYNSHGWFNTSASRSIGWHHARIAVASATNTPIPVAFYIDDMVHPALSNTITNGSLFNCIEIEPDNQLSDGSPDPYFDDLSFYNHAPGPGTLQINPAGTNVIVNFPDFWILQTSSNLNPTAWTDITNSVNSYTAPATNGTRFFRLRSF